MMALFFLKTKDGMLSLSYSWISSKKGSTYQPGIDAMFSWHTVTYLPVKEEIILMIIDSWLVFMLDVFPQNSGTLVPWQYLTVRNWNGQQKCTSIIQNLSSNTLELQAVW